MTEREVLKLALEALEEFGEHYDWCHQFPTYAFPENYPPCNCGYDKAITAIKEALREHAMYEVQRLGQEIQPEPPQRTWVGLTPQERDEINEQVYGAVPHHVAFHHALEAKLKQKNGYDS